MELKNTDKKGSQIGELTPAMLGELKPTLGDLPDSKYDHVTQTRKFSEGADAPSLEPDTLFDGEST
jgi:hypothetical protein